jgi:hypothetical protein
MVKLLRRVFWLGLLGGAGFAGFSAWQRKAEPAGQAGPQWPPFEPTRAAQEAVGFAGIASETHPEAASDSTVSWMRPVDGACPDGYPIKANEQSMIFHVPGGLSYERTIPERCYARAEDAEADGYRRAKR